MVTCRSSAVACNSSTNCLPTIRLSSQSSESVLLILFHYKFIPIQQQDEAFATSTVSKIYFENVVLYTDEFR